MHSGHQSALRRQQQQPYAQIDRPPIILGRRKGIHGSAKSPVCCHKSSIVKSTRTLQAWQGRTVADFKGSFSEENMMTAV